MVKLRLAIPVFGDFGDLTATWRSGRQAHTEIINSTVLKNQVR